jgi:hypothetical protein
MARNSEIHAQGGGDHLTVIPLPLNDREESASTLFVHCILRRNNAPQAQKTEGDRGRNPSFSQAKLAGSLFATKENVMDRRPTHARVVVSLRLIFFVMALIVTDSQIALAQREKLPVFVDYLGDDSVGSNVVFQFKEV